MANDDIPVSFLAIHCNSFYFSEEKRDFETDAFQKSDVKKYHFKSNDNKFLLLNAEDFEFENLTDKKQQNTEHEINVQIYKNNHLDEKKTGRAVMLYVCKGQQKWVACCRGNFEIYAKAMDQELPKNLDKTHDDTLFYMEELSVPDTYLFESKLHQGWFLGFQCDDDNASQHKLALIHNRNEVDNASPILVTECKCKK